MNEPITLTRDELTRRIAKLRGYKIFEHLDGGITIYDTDRASTGDPLRDANAALELLQEMNQQNCPHDENEGDYPVLTGCWSHGWRFDMMFAHHDGDGEQFTLTGKTFCEAIGLAWHEWKTGQRVTLRESEPQL